ncbi:MAG: thioredoxin fold domain-containing protein [Campylobacterota bacterium]|nr:thioredoxin fold domain-containing protein [Campylobacterota bacterium]
MKKTYKKVLAILMIFGFVTTSLYAVTGKVSGAQMHEMPEWFKESFLDLQEDIEEAGESNKHVMLFLTLDACPYCTKLLHDSFEKDSSVKTFIQKNFDVIGINIKGSREIAINENLTLTEKEYAKYLKVQYTPTVLFLNDKNEVVVRINGYRSSKNFQHILNYVESKSYVDMTLTKYLEKAKDKTLYKLTQNKLFSKVSDLSSVTQPLAVIFEDGGCTQCSYLHNVTLKNEEVKKELSKFTVVQLNASSNEIIINPKGEQTTPKKWAEELKLDYRPGIVLFDAQKEVIRIDALLYSFHFKEVFRYVSGGFYNQYTIFLDYLGIRQTELLNRGIDIDISDK